MWIVARASFYRFGLPPEACVRDARQVANVWVAQNVVELPGHGFFGGESVRMAARAGGSLPAVVGATTWYGVAPTTDADFFSLSGITFTDGGSGVISVLEDFGPKIDAMLAGVASYIVANAKAYAGPWTTAPAWAERLACHLAAPEVANALRIASSRYDVEGVKDRAKTGESLIKRLAAGEPMTDGLAPIDATPTIAEAGARSARIRPGPFGAPIVVPLGGVVGPGLSGDRANDLTALVGAFDEGSDRV